MLDAPQTAVRTPVHSGELVPSEWSIEMSLMPRPRFELKKITDSEWLVLDHRYRPNDARRTVACVYEMEPHLFEAVWLRDLPLGRSYMSAADVLEDVQRFYARERSRRPIPIPHLPPMAAV